MSDVTPTVPDKTPGGYENPSALHTLLDAIVTRLEGQALVAAKGVRVLPEFHADLYNKLVAIMNRKMAVLIQVGFERINKGDKCLAVYFRDMQIVVDVYESVLFNQSASGTKVSSLSFAEACAIRLHGWQPEKTSVLLNPGTLNLAENGTLQMDREKSDLKNGVVCYSINLTTGGCLAAHAS
jgi:hypothetical protein